MGKGQGCVSQTEISVSSLEWLVHMGAGRSGEGERRELLRTYNHHSTISFRCSRTWTDMYIAQEPLSSVYSITVQEPLSSVYSITVQEPLSSVYSITVGT